jgi:hypothetical protein
LIAHGHPPERVWAMTPRVATGFAWFAWRRRRHESALALEIASLGARGDGKEIDELLKRWRHE